MPADDISQSKPAADAPVVTVRGEAQRDVPPDLATVSLSAHANGPSAERVRAALAAASVRVAEVIGRFPRAIEQHSTTGFSVFPVFDRRAGTRVTGYRGNLDTQVVVSDLDRLSDIVFALTSLPDSQLSGPWWSLRPNHPARREVRIDAIADARSRAADYAAAFGAVLAGLVEVSDLETGFAAPMPRMAFAMAKAEVADTSVEFAPSPQTVSAQVTVRFTISTPEPPVSAR